MATESDLQIYLKQINDSPLLSPEEEKELGGIIQDAHDRTESLHEFLDSLTRHKREAGAAQAAGVRRTVVQVLREMSRSAHSKVFSEQELVESGLPYVKLLEEKYDQDTHGDLTELARKVFDLVIQEAVSSKKAQLAREQMIHCNLRLVVNIAKTYANRGMTLADLIEEGNLGLLRAVEGFDPVHETRFSTYASWWIKQAIKRALINTVQPVHIPAYMVEMIARWKQTQEEFLEREGRQPSLQELADALQMSKRKVRIIKQAVKAFSSPTQSGHGEEGLTLSEMLTDEKTPTPDEAMFNQAESEMIQRLLDKIDAREAKILRLRYGLDNDRKPMTLKEIGAKIGLTRERVRQIEHEALRKLNQLLTEL